MWTVKLLESKSMVKLTLAFDRQTVTTGALSELDARKSYDYDDLDPRQKMEIVETLLEVLRHECDKINQKSDANFSSDDCDVDEVDEVPEVYQPKTVRQRVEEMYKQNLEKNNE